jgi:hypothetical protein
MVVPEFRTAVLVEAAQSIIKINKNYNPFTVNFLGNQAE